MSGNFLLYTNIVIALFESDNNVIINLKTANLIFLSSIVVGELFYGAYNSLKKEKNIKKIIDFCSETNIISCDYNTAFYYGKIKKQLKAIGKPIPENDIWIAAISIQNNLPLISRDKHLSFIQDLELISW